MRISHLSSVHPRYDTRIFLKECRSLAKAGHHVSLVVADGKGRESRDGVTIYDVGAHSGRLDRMYKGTRKIFEKAKSLDADVYHLHDPELIPAGLRLKRLGKTVIFDAHEDVPKQILSKHYLNRATRQLLSKGFGIYEAWACRKLDAVVTATPYIREKFLAINPNSVDINNFPMLGELATGEIDWSQKKNQVCYVGGIGAIRGIKQVVKAMGLVKGGTRLRLGGKFSSQSDEAETKGYAGWANVDALGHISRDEVRDILACSIAGLVTFLPAPNHIDAQPNKMFEYMSAGVPVIASDFPLWREIVIGNDCGLCVDPLDPRAIADAIDFLVANPKRAEEMGRNGQRAVNERYNWGAEERKLLQLYSSLG